MGRTPKLAPDARAKKLIEQGRQLREKLDHTRLMVFLKGRPDLVASIKKDLQDSGEIAEDFTALKDGPGVRVKTESVEEGVAAAVGGVHDGDGVAGSGADGADPEGKTEDEDNEPLEDGDVIIHRNFARWQDIPPQHIQEILRVAEPVALSVHNLKVLVKKGCRVPPRWDLLELLEAMADIDPSSNIGNTRRLKRLSREVSETNCRNGRRLREIQLPMDWPRDGLFEAGCKEPCLMVTYRPTGASIVISERCATPETMKGIKIENNWSKMRAIITFANGSQHVNIALEFSKAGVSLVDAPAVGFKRSLSFDSASVTSRASVPASLTDAMSPTAKVPPKRHRCEAAPAAEGVEEQVEGRATAVKEEIAQQPGQVNMGSQVKTETGEGHEEDLFGGNFGGMSQGANISGDPYNGVGDDDFCGNPSDAKVAEALTSATAAAEAGFVPPKPE